jgi:O-antigen/teichoic acid export membrane protein
MKHVAAQSWPFGLAGIFYLVYFQSDIILLKYMVSDEAAGIYNVAFVIMAAVYMLPSVIYQKFLLPKIHRWANHDRERFYQVYRTGNWVMLILGLLAMLAIWLLAPFGVQFLFGSSYVGAVLPLSILALAAPLRFLGSSAGSFLSTQSHLIKKLYIMCIVALVNIVLNFLIIPIYGAIGAAVTTVFSELLMVFIMHIYARKYLFTDLDRG